jgi:hypothetical protein
LRNKIFYEIYKILYDSNNDIAQNDIQRENDIDSHDNINDIKNIDEKTFGIFLDKKYDNKIKKKIMK